DRFLLFGDFQRLDRHLNLAGLRVVGGDARVDLLADGDALGALLVTVTRQVGTLDEAVRAAVAAANLDAAVLDGGDFAGHDRVLARLAVGADGRGRTTRQLLDAERDALLLDVDVENLRLHHLALLVLLDDLLARTGPVEVGEVHHAVHVAFEADEQAELGLVLDLALDLAADRMVALEGFPRILERLLEAERDAALGRIDLQHH